MSAHRTILGSTLAAATAVLPASAAEPMSEHISIVYQKIAWTHSKQKIEHDFRRVAAEKGLKLTAAEIAGAAQAAFDGGVLHTDDWNTNQMVIRGCGPAKDLCFVITCKRCSPR